jgi:hypothetical protein
MDNSPSQLNNSEQLVGSLTGLLKTSMFICQEPSLLEVFVHFASLLSRKQDLLSPFLFELPVRHGRDRSGRGGNAGNAKQALGAVRMNALNPKKCC